MAFEIMYTDKSGKITMETRKAGNVYALASEFTPIADAGFVVIHSRTRDGLTTYIFRDGALVARD